MSRGRIGFASLGVALGRVCPVCGGSRHVFSLSIYERAWWCDVPVDDGDERRHDLPGEAGRGSSTLDLTN